MRPSASLTLAADALTLDGSLRYDFGSARGSIAGADLGGGRVGIISRDMNGDGVISTPETKVSSFRSAARRRSTKNYHSLLLGGRELPAGNGRCDLCPVTAAARANADRLLFGPAVSMTTGKLTDSCAAVDFVHQLEGGIKYRSGGLTLNATGFHAKTEEQNFKRPRKPSSTATTAHMASSWRAAIASVRSA